MQVLMLRTTTGIGFSLLFLLPVTLDASFKKCRELEHRFLPPEPTLQESVQDILQYSSFVAGVVKVTDTSDCDQGAGSGCRFLDPEDHKITEGRNQMRVMESKIQSRLCPDGEGFLEEGERYLVIAYPVWHPSSGYWGTWAWTYMHEDPTPECIGHLRSLFREAIESQMDSSGDSPRNSWNVELPEAAPQ